MSGRILVAVGNDLRWSLPFAYSWFREGCDVVRFPAKLTMVAVLPGGVWVSDQNRVYFLPGHDPGQWAAIPHEERSPAIPGTVRKCDGTKLASLGVAGLCCIWTSPAGLCVGTGQGQLVNLTQGRLTYPVTNNGSALVIDNQRYVCTLF